MGLFDRFKKKEKVRVGTIEDFKVDVPKEPVAVTAALDHLQEKEKKEAEAAKVKPADFKSWYASLDPDMKRKVDKRLEKTYFRTGTPILCKVCKQAGGTLKKVGDGYIHVGCIGEEI